MSGAGAGTGPGAGSGTEDDFDETVVVSQLAVEDATVVVAKPAVEDATVVVAKPVVKPELELELELELVAEPDLEPVIDDATIVVAIPAQDATVVVARAAPEDATVVVAKPAAQPEPEAPVDDATIAVALPAPVSKPESRPEQKPEPKPERKPQAAPAPAPDGEDATVVVAMPAQPDDDSTRVVGRTGDPAPPVPEPEYSSEDLAKLMFKPPLDPRRRVKPAPFEQPDHTLPKRGVRQGMPVIFGETGPQAGEQGSSPLDLERRIGAVPKSTALTPAARDGLPSMAQLNRKFRLLALAGGAGVVVVVALGLWGIATLAFG